MIMGSKNIYLETVRPKHSKNAWKMLIYTVCY